MQQTQAAWPDGVIARYLTVGHATADVIDDTTDNGPHFNSVTHKLRGACTGERCPETFWSISFCSSKDEDLEKDEEFQREIAQIQAWAQRHAEKCRAMPRPDGGA